MSVVRTIVFPALRLLVWAVIAVALVVLAFGGGGGITGRSRGRPGPPDARADLAHRPGRPGHGAEHRDRARHGRRRRRRDGQGDGGGNGPAAAGRRRAPRSPPGQALLEIRSEEERPPVTGTDAEGTRPSTPQTPLVRTTTVTAPAAGTLTTLDVLVDQIVAVGDKVGAISPGTLSVTATLTQADQFRLLAPPATAEVEVQGGPAPFTCTGLVLGGPAPAGADPAGDAGGGPDRAAGAPATGGTTARCAVPAGATVFAGMGATVRVAGRGTPTNVLVVPVTAVQGSVARRQRLGRRRRRRAGGARGHARADRRRADRGARGAHRGRARCSSSCRCADDETRRGRRTDDRS